MYCKRLLILSIFGLIGTLPPPSASAQVSINVPNTSYSQEFNALPASSTATFTQNSTLPGWYAERSGNGTSILAGTGSSTTGGLYSFGIGTDAERALGSIGSSNAAAGNFTYGWRLKNQTGATITSLQITFTGEQWRNSAAAAQTIDFSYFTSTGEITTTTPGGGASPTGYVPVDEGDFTSPVTGGTAGALNGNVAASQITKTFTISGLALANGSEIMLRWYDPDHSGSDHGLAIDNVSVTATTDGPVVVTPVLTAQPTTLNGFSATTPMPSAAQSYSLTGSNLKTAVTATAPTDYQISSNGTDYAGELTLTPTNGILSTTLSVRLSGSSVGTFAGTITHVSGSVTASVSVNGTVSDDNTFATIAEARTKPDNTPISALPGGKLAGRVTVSNQFGNTAYIQDATGGMAVFNNAFIASVEIGDSVQITGGIIGSFSQQKQLTGNAANAFTFIKIGAVGAPVAKTIALAQLSAYEGQLVSIPNAVIRPATLVDAANPVFVFTPDANALIQDGSGLAQFRIDKDTNLPGNTNPASAQMITGVVGRFNASLQLQPRSTADVPTSVPYTVAGGELDRSRSFDVTAWNIEWLGNGPNGPTDEELQFQNASRVLNTFQSDVIVLEEISSADAISRLAAGMPGYQGNCSPFVSNNPGHEIPANPATPATVPGDAQRVCVLYRTDAVSLVSQKPLLEKVQSLPGYPADASNFWASGRYPYMWTFDVKVGASTRRINVIGIHAKANTAPLQTSYDRRKYDVQVLYDSLKAQYPNELLLLAGDINDDVDRTVANVPQTESTYKPFTDDAANFLIPTRTLSDNGFRTYLTSDNVIDHIIVSNELAPAYVAGTAGVATPYLQIANYGTTTSDHVPVFARFDLSRLVPPLSVTATTVSATVCPGSPADVALTVAGGESPYTYSVNGGSPASSGAFTNGISTTATVSGLQTGVQTLSIVITDAASRTVSTTVTVTVEDKTAPVARTRNASLTLNEQGQATLTPELVDAASTDNCGPVSFSLSQTQFSCANVGDNTVTLLVTDPSGNTATATAVVTVGPITVAPNYQTSTGQTNVTVPQYSGNVVFSADNCAGQLSWVGSNGLSGTGPILAPTTVTGTFSYTGRCTVGACSGPAATVSITVAAEALKLLTPGLDCTTGELKLSTTGGNGNPIEFQIAAVTKGWETGTTYTVDAKARSRELKINARQRKADNRGWDTAELTYQPGCPSLARLAAAEVPLQVRVLSNPLQNGQVAVEVVGAAGGPLRLTLTDLKGREIGTRFIEQAGILERINWSVADRPAGVFLLRVRTSQEQQVLRLLKP